MTSLAAQTITVARSACNMAQWVIKPIHNACYDIRARSKETLAD